MSVSGIFASGCINAKTMSVITPYVNMKLFEEAIEYCTESLMS